MIACVKNFGGIELKPSWSKELIFTLNAISFKHVVKVLRGRTLSGAQMKYAVIPLHGACGIISLILVFERKLVPSIMSYRQESL